MLKSALNDARKEVAVSRKARVEVTRETSTGRNTQFRDTRTGHVMSRGEFVQRIERGDYDGYHVRKVNGVPTPASNPDGSDGNNLG
jgi:hypothetical protein